MKFIIEADGGSRGNPGIAGAGAAVIDASTGSVLREISQSLGIATNNFAEYTALLLALEAANDIDPTAELVIRMDSKLVIEQMSGRWKIKHPDMATLGAKVQNLLRGRRVELAWIPREINNRADALANRAMDGVSIAAAGAVEFNTREPSSIRAPRPSEEACTTLVLVRHGRTALTESHKISGGDGENPPLSALGSRDAAEVAAEIARFGGPGNFSYLSKPSAVVHSPILRTTETAASIAKSLGLGLNAIDELREIGFGEWDGLSNEEVFTAFEAEFASWQGSYEVAPPGGESLKEFDLRVQSAFDQILESYRGETVVLVSHVMPIRAILRIANDASIAGFWRTTVSPASISIVRFWGRSAAEVVCVNSTAHLSS